MAAVLGAHRERLRGALAVLGISLACAALAACGSSPAAAPSPGAPEPTPAANPLTSAVETTTALGTAQVAIGTSSRVGTSREWRVAGSGTVDLGQRLGLLLLRSGEQDQAVLKNREGTFISPDGGVTWYVLPTNDETPHSGSIDVLRGLADLPFHSSEPAVVDGIDATRYDAVIPADVVETAIAGMGISLEDPAVLNGWVEPLLAVSVWVDDSGRIIRVERTLTADTDAGPLSATSIVSLSDFGAAIDLTSPDSAEPAPQL